MLFTATFISIFLCSWVVGTRLFDVGKANFYTQEQEEVSPPSDVTLPTITISSPKNNTVYRVNNVSLTFNVHVVVPILPELFYYYLDLSEVYYEASWLSNKTYLDVETIRNSVPRDRFFSEDNYARWNTYWAIRGYEISPNFSISVEGVPEGSHSLEVSAVLRGSRKTSQSSDRYGTPVIHYGRYKLIGSSVITFTVDSTSILSPLNKTYDISDVPLLFKVDKSVTQISYSLDGQDNVMVVGNTTLTGLSNGEHNVTVYATDEAGNTGASETITFSVEVPFPVAPVAAASVATVAVVGVGLLVYFRKRKR